MIVLNSLLFPNSQRSFHLEIQFPTFASDSQSSFFTSSRVTSVHPSKTIIRSGSKLIIFSFIHFTSVLDHALPNPALITSISVSKFFSS